jgi:hypothetical protein
VRSWHLVTISFSKVAVSGQKRSPDSTFCPEIAIIHIGAAQHVLPANSGLATSMGAVA